MGNEEREMTVAIAALFRAAAIVRGDLNIGGGLDVGAIEAAKGFVGACKAHGLIHEKGGAAGPQHRK